MRANTAKLVHAGKATKDRPISDMNVARECRVVRHDRVAADDAIVRDMHVSHDPVVITDDRFTLILHGAAADRAKLANRISFADDQTCPFASVLLVLRIIAD